jgi:chromosomal replication initiator protein
MARTACGAIAEGDTSIGQAVYLKAGHGLGKSHLTQAVAHHVLRNRRGEVIVYRTAHQFTADMVRSIRSGDMDGFNRTYHGCDVLLLENLPALSGRTKSQEVIVQAIDTLTERGKRIIYTGNLAPLEIDGIDPELRSKLSSALIATINPPDRRTRTHIVRRKAKNCGLVLADELVEMLARDLTGDIRRVESAIATIKARADLEKKTPDHDLVESVLRDILGRERALTAEAIRDFIADQFRIPVPTLRSRTRKRAVALPRQIGMYLARKHTSEGLAAIGRAFNRDHSTVVHAVRTVTEQINRSTSIRKQVELFDRKLKGEE